MGTTGDEGQRNFFFRSGPLSTVFLEWDIVDGNSMANQTDVQSIKGFRLQWQNDCKTTLEFARKCIFDFKRFGVPIECSSY